MAEVKRRGRPKKNATVTGVSAPLGQGQETVTVIVDGKSISIPKGQYEAMMRKMLMETVSPVEKAKANLETISKAVPFLKNLAVINAIDSTPWAFALIKGQDDKGTERVAIVKFNGAFAQLSRGVIDLTIAKSLFKL